MHLGYNLAQNQHSDLEETKDPINSRLPSSRDSEEIVLQK